MGYTRIPPCFSACNNKFSLDAALSTAHNWRHRGKGWTGDPRHPPLLHPPLSLLGSPSHPIPCVRRDCTARGRYWGAYGSAQGDAPVRLSLPLSLYLSIYLFQSTLARDYVHTHTRARIYSLSLSLSVAMIIRLCPACRHIRRVYDSVPLSRQCLPTPGFIQRRSDRALFGSPSFFGRRGKRFMGGG